MRSHALHAAWVQHDATMRAKRSDHRWCAIITGAIVGLILPSIVTGQFVIAACLAMLSAILMRITWLAYREYEAATATTAEAWREYEDVCIRQAWGIERWLVDASGIFNRNGAYVDDPKRGVS